MRETRAAGDISVNIANLTESIPSIHTGPAEFKRMISPNGAHKSNEFTEEMFEQKMQELRIKSARKKLPRTGTLPGESTQLPKPTVEILQYSGPQTLSGALSEIGMSKYESLFKAQDVDLHVFLTLNDHDLKEIGVKLFGPRRKMTTAIARINGNIHQSSSAVERGYADGLASRIQDLTNNCALNEKRLAEVSQLLKNEKQLRLNAEQWVQEVQVQNEQLRKFLYEIAQVIGELSTNNNSKDHLLLLQKNILKNLDSPKQ